jgi:predicted RNA-binding protein
MPKTLEPLYGLNAWAAIRDPESMPYYMKRGIASLIWRENGKSEKAYIPGVSSEQFIKAFNIIGASLVDNKALKRPDSVQGVLDLTVEGEAKQRLLKKPRTKSERDRLKRARSAVKYLNSVLSQLKEDLEAGVIKEKT